MAFKNVLLVLALISMALAVSTAARNDYNNLHIKPGYNLEARLVASGGLTECWYPFLELKSCTNEIILFFLNGEASLGTDCWPGMLIALGFTAEEGHLLAGPPVADADASSMIDQLPVLVESSGGKEFQKGSCFISVLSFIIFTCNVFPLRI